jgi:hypothetical protein
MIQLGRRADERGRLNGVHARHSHRDERRDGLTTRQLSSVITIEDGFQIVEHEHLSVRVSSVYAASRENAKCLAFHPVKPGAIACRM